MFNLNDALLLVRAVERGGFAPAARALGISKSKISTRIAALEQQLGARLVNRTSRTFAMTAVGKEFYEHAKSMLVAAECAELVVRSRTAEPSGTVRLTSSSATLHAGLGPVLQELVNRYPKLRLVHHASNHAADLVEEGFDLAVRAHVDPLPDSSLIQRALGFSPRWLVAAPAYLESHGEPGHPADLTGHALIGMPWSSHSSAWEIRSESGETVPVAVELTLATDDLPTVLAAAAAGLGISVAPMGMCLAPIAQGQLRRVLPAWSSGGAFITLLTTHRRGQLPSVRAALDVIAERLPVAMGLVGGG